MCEWWLGLGRRQRERDERSDSLHSQRSDFESLQVLLFLLHFVPLVILRRSEVITIATADSAGLHLECVHSDLGPPDKLCTWTQTPP